MLALIMRDAFCCIATCFFLLRANSHPSPPRRVAQHCFQRNKFPRSCPSYMTSLYVLTDLFYMFHSDFLLRQVNVTNRMNVKYL